MKAFLGVDDKSMGEVLKVHRKANRMTQQKVAEYLGIHRSTYAKYETGRKPEIDVVLKLSVLYRISIDDFMKSFFKETESELSPVAVLASPDMIESVVEVTRDERRLLMLYRDCIRKSEIMKAAEEVFQQDKDILEEIQSF